MSAPISINRTAAGCGAAAASVSCTPGRSSAAAARLAQVPAPMSPSRGNATLSHQQRKHLSLCNLAEISDRTEVKFVKHAVQHKSTTFKFIYCEFLTLWCSLFTAVQLVPPQQPFVRAGQVFRATNSANMAELDWDACCQMFANARQMPARCLDKVAADALMVQMDRQPCDLSVALLAALHSIEARCARLRNPLYGLDPLAICWQRHYHPSHHYLQGRCRRARCAQLSVAHSAYNFAVAQQPSAAGSPTALRRSMRSRTKRRSRVSCGGITCSGLQSLHCPPCIEQFALRGRCASRSQ